MNRLAAMSDSDESVIISSSSLEISSDDDNESIENKRKRYRRSIHHGLSKRQARYYRDSASFLSGSLEGPQVQQIHSESSPVLSDSSPSLSDSTSLSDSQSEMDDTQEADDRVDEEDTRKPLFEGSVHNLFTAYSLVMLYVMKHSLSRQAFSDLLLLIQCLLPNSNFTTSVYKIKEVLKKAMSFKEPSPCYYCDHCQSALKQEHLCQKVACRRNKSKTVKFLDLSVKDQLADFFQDDWFYRTVNRHELSVGSAVMKDVTDGSKYIDIQREYAQRLEKADVHLTFTMNTDGVSVFSSSKKGNLWPVYLAINELPTKIRFSRKYIIPCYLHCEVEKPNMMTYLMPLIETLKELYSKGIEVVTSSGRVLKVTGQLLTASVDLPARALVANMKQFNGKSACITCLDEGECPPGQSLARYYPFRENSVLRSHNSVLHDAREATRGTEAVNGVKGASPLIVLKYIDLPLFFAIDWMHCVLLGVVKSLLSFWFDSKHRNERFFIGHKISLLNKRLLNIKIPDFISRRQRSLSDYSHWKASECREWLIHFSIPVLYGQLDQTAFLHYTLLVTSMAILTNDNIRAEDIEYADQLLLDFCRVFPSVYGVRKQTMNVHLLKHVTQFTRLYGPLFSHSAFGFESMNSYIKNLVHGTGHVNSQISFAVAMSKSLGKLVKDLTKESSTENIKKTALCLGSKFVIDETSPNSVVMALGKKRALSPTDDAWQFIPAQKQQKAYLCTRIQTPNGVYHSKRQQETKTKNSYTVAFYHDNEIKFGLIKSFVEVECTLYALMKPFDVTSFSLKREFIMNVQSDILKNYEGKMLCPQLSTIMDEGQTILVHSNDLRKKCVYIDVHSAKYVSCPPNLQEHG